MYLWEYQHPTIGVLQTPPESNYEDLETDSQREATSEIFQKTHYRPHLLKTSVFCLSPKHRSFFHFPFDLLVIFKITFAV